MQKIAFVTWLLAFTSLGTVHAASFACSHATLKAEKTICQVRALNDADVKMATTYQIILHALPMGGRGQQQELQGQWLKSRNQCGENTTCLRDAYQQRQQQLDDLVQQRILSHGPF